MNPQGMLASAAINICLAVVVLALFSIFKKQPSNAPIYYARRLSRNQHVPFDHSLTLSRFLPSFSWISRASRVSEDDILQTSGLDALLVIRLLKFGINFFTVCSLIGLVVLLPVNYCSHNGLPRSHKTLDSFTIANIGKGSNWLWVHFVCLWVVSFYGLYLLYKEYDDIMNKRINQLRNIRDRPDQFSVLVRQIPFCVEHKTRHCSVDHFFSKHHPHSYYSCRILYDGKEFEDLTGQAKYITKEIEDLRERSSVNKNKTKSLLLDVSHENIAKIALHEEKLQEIFHQIHRLQGENMLKELPVAFVTFKCRRAAALAAQSQQHWHPLKWITEGAPEPRDVSWRNLTIPYRILPLNRIAVIVAASLLTIFFAIPVTAVQGIANFEKLKKWFLPLRAIELIPGLSSIVMGYLPSVILNGSIYVVPFIMFSIAKLGGSVSKSKVEIKTCNMVFYFLVGNVFFLSMISGSLLEEIGESVIHPKYIPNHLARAVSAQADFFLTYILADGLSGFFLEALQASILLLDFIKSHTCGRGNEKNPYLYSLPYCRVIPVVSLSILIGSVYAVVSPLLLPVLVGYFFLGYTVYVNQIEDVYETVYETCGRYWPYIHHYIFVGFILMQITVIGLFGLKSKPAPAIATIPLVCLTIMFNEYCKMRFLPTFLQDSIQNAVENDELDEKNGQLEVNYRNASNAYFQPSLQPLNFMEYGSSLTQPLVSSL